MLPTPTPGREAESLMGHPLSFLHGKCPLIQTKRKLKLVRYRSLEGFGPSNNTQFEMVFADNDKLTTGTAEQARG